MGFSLEYHPGLPYHDHRQHRETAAFDLAVRLYQAQERSNINSRQNYETFDNLKTSADVWCWKPENVCSI